jgi:hypothetical protein
MGCITLIIRRSDSCLRILQNTNFRHNAVCLKKTGVLLCLELTVANLPILNMVAQVTHSLSIKDVTDSSFKNTVAISFGTNCPGFFKLINVCFPIQNPLVHKVLEISFIYGGSTLMIYKSCISWVVFLQMKRLVSHSDWSTLWNIFHDLNVTETFR